MGLVTAGIICKALIKGKYHPPLITFILKKPRLNLLNSRPGFGD